MALAAEDGKDRAEQLLAVTERLTELIVEETRRLEARQPPLEGEAGEEKNRLANAYRLELARVKQDPGLIKEAPPALLRELRQSTVRLHEALAGHETALGAVKLVAEGLVNAMAEEVVRQRSGTSGYGARGAPQSASSPTPALIDRNA